MPCPTVLRRHKGPEGDMPLGSETWGQVWTRTRELWRWKPVALANASTCTLGRESWRHLPMHVTCGPSEGCLRPLAVPKLGSKEAASPASTEGCL
jgi:hypothetical protein